MIMLVHLGHDFLRLIPRNEMEIFTLNQEYIFKKINGIITIAYM